MISHKLGEHTKQLVFKNGKTITLVGTAHVSQKSVDEVKSVIDEVKPDHICLELDAGRWQSKTQPQDWKNQDIRKVFKTNKAFLMIANMALAGYQKRMGDQTGSAPGEEIISAGHIAEEQHIPFSLCDREIQITLKRAWRKSSFWNKMKLLGELAEAVFSKEEVTPEELEQLKNNATMQSMLQDLAKELPTVKQVLIDERDQYLATSIWNAPGTNIVAIIGAGHQNGIVKQFRAYERGYPTADLKSISEVPPASKASKVISFLIPATIIAIIAWGFARAGWQQGAKMFGYWVAVNAIFTAIGGIIGLAHPLNIVISALASPFTSLNPTIGVGIVSGLVEATLHKPKVRDFEGLAEDATHVSAWYKNRILHALLVFLTCSVGSSVGTIIAFPVLLKLLG